MSFSAAAWKDGDGLLKGRVKKGLLFGMESALQCVLATIERTMPNKHCECLSMLEIPTLHFILPLTVFSPWEYDLICLRKACNSVRKIPRISIVL